MKSKITILAVLISLSTLAQAQWSNEGNNYTTGTLQIGLTGYTGDKLKVIANGGQRSVGLFGATGTGAAGIYFDASNGDFIGSDYGSLLQNNDLSISLTNSGSNPIFFKTANSTRFTILGNGNVGIGTTSPDHTLEVRVASSDGSASGHGIRIGTATNGLNIGANDTGNNAWIQTRYGDDLLLNHIAGNVGIGTTVPNSRLEVYNTAELGHLLLSANDNPNADRTRIDLDFEIANRNHVIGRIASFYTSSANGGSGGLRFYSRYAGSLNESLRIDYTGNVGIGTASPSEKLVVDGKILAEEVKVQSVPASDYVFEPDYDLKPMEEVEAFIKENKHLPDIPSAEEFKENGVGLGEMDDMLLRKVEELMLYIIALEKKNKEQDEIIRKLLNEKDNE